MNTTKNRLIKALFLTLAIAVIILPLLLTVFNPTLTYEWQNQRLLKKGVVKYGEIETDHFSYNIYYFNQGPYKDPKSLTLAEIGEIQSADEDEWPSNELGTTLPELVGCKVYTAPESPDYIFVEYKDDLLAFLFDDRDVTL